MNMPNKRSTPLKPTFAKYDIPVKRLSNSVHYFKIFSFQALWGGGLISERGLVYLSIKSLIIFRKHRTKSKFNNNCTKMC